MQVKAKLAIGVKLETENITNIGYNVDAYRDAIVLSSIFGQQTIYVVGVFMAQTVSVDKVVLRDLKVWQMEASNQIDLFKEKYGITLDKNKIAWYLGVQIEQ